MGDDKSITIREVDPTEAEAVLAVRWVIHGATTGAEEYHLARVPRPARVIESATVNADGSVTTRSTQKREALVTYCTHADGPKDGYGKMVSIRGHSADHVTVHISMSWRAGGERGSFDEEIVVPWLGAARVEVSGGWAEARIAPRA